MIKLCFSAEEMSSQIRLRLLPTTRCLYDKPIQVKVSHLRSRQVVTIKASSTDEKGVLFSSSATYRADGNGDIDLVRDASLSGSYVGVEPMGLLRTLKPNTLNTYFYKNKALEPHTVKFSVHDEEQDQILAEAINERLLMADGVSRVSVKEGNFHGVLFTPPGTGPFPAVLDLCTFMSERRAALLANKGFVVLTLPVFQEKLGNLKMLALDPFEEAINFLLQQQKVTDLIYSGSLFSRDISTYQKYLLVASKPEHGNMFNDVLCRTLRNK
uniref:Acyl-CoA thioester hydrolase/bile acid-CoA amino acid N-acetyltransferase domain-containing protein n=1 Tax=Oryzias melastigma TaxID=30732 RepID=A0A3B3E0S1_ORYME